MNLQLDKKTALVTGSTAGIGKAIAKQLAGEGVHVIVNGRTEGRIQQAISEIQNEYPSCELTSMICDFGREDSILVAVQDLPEIDILVNNVGIFEPKEFTEIRDQDWFRLFEVNVMSGVRLSRKLLPGMLERNWGRIVFISSESGVQIPEEMIHYGMTKTAQIALSNGIARLTKGSGVTVNTVLPGSTWSEGAAEFIGNLAIEQGKTKKEITQAFFKEVRPNCLLQRFATTEEVANLVTYLCSPLASATNGASLRVDGGTVPTIL